MASGTEDLNYYKMDYPKRGTAVIINNKIFKAKYLDQREGTEADGEALVTLFTDMGFEKILLSVNLTADEIRRELDEVSREDYPDSSCFVCVLLTHGNHEYIYGTDTGMAVGELFQPFSKGNKCRSLVGKPKLIFYIGEIFYDGTDVTDTAMKPRSPRRIPSDADFFIAYSVVGGYASWRHTEFGSWFIQAVFKIFQENWKRLDLLTMMTRVNKMVAYEFESETGEELIGKSKWLV